MLIVIITLTPEPGSSSGTAFFGNLLPRTRHDCVDVILNIALFVPLGIALTAARVRSRDACLMAMLLTTGVEVAQLWLPGRDASARDILANSLGACLGVAMMTRPRVAQIVAAVHGGIDRPIERSIARPDVAARYAFGSALIASLAFLLPRTLTMPASQQRVFLVSSALLDVGSDDIRIGSDGNPNGAFFGLIDEVRIYGKARSREEVRGDMRAPLAADSRGDRDLRLAYDFDEGTGNRVWDKSAQGHNGEVHQAEWSPTGRFGGALQFNGRTSQVIVERPAELRLRDSLSIEAWVFPLAQVPHDANIVNRAGAWFLRTSTDQQPGAAAAGGRFGGHYDDARAPERTRENSWTHLAWSYDGRTIAFYENGDLVAINERWSPHRTSTLVLNGVHLEPGLVQSASLGRALSADLELNGTLQCGFERSTGPVFLMVNSDMVALSVRALGNDLLLRGGTVADRIGGSGPWFRMPDALSSCQSGTTLNLRATGKVPRLLASVNGVPAHGAVPGPGSAWTFFVHSELLPSWVETACTLGWIAWLTLPFGFFASRRWPALAGALIIVAALVVPADRLRAAEAREFGAATLGALTGVAVRRRPAGGLFALRRDP
jgi:VanZ family protein